MKDYGRFSFYESFAKQIEIVEQRLGKDVAYDLTKAIWNYGLYNELPDELSPLWLYGFSQIIANIDSYKDKCDRGAASGRKTIELDIDTVLRHYASYGNWKDVARLLAIDEKTLRNNRNKWDEETNGTFSVIAKQMRQDGKNGKNINEFLPFWEKWKEWE